MRARGLWADVQSRTKSIDSILRKLILKPEYTYDSLLDLVGVRVIVRYVHEVKQVSELVAGLFNCSEADDKAVRLAEDGVGYLSIHREARLKAADAEIERYPATQFRAEVQMRTLAQHLWAEMSHDTFYKTDERAISSELKRRINLMAGLLEVADNEFARLSGEVAELPDMLETGLLRRLEASYFQFAADRGNPDLSLEVIKLLLPLYAAEPATITAQIEEFVAARRATINAVFDEQRHLPERRSAFMFQPEVLMLYERLEHDAMAVRERWATMFPEHELEKIALAFGISFDE
jgi:ppGpp synthetase/RelA/SpoT-type nucleotidyltranferase